MTKLREASPATLVELIREGLERTPDAVLYRFLRYPRSGEVVADEWTYRRLDSYARSLAARLGDTASPGARALLVSSTPADFIGAFFGCLYAGIIAVPVYPPSDARRASSLERLHAIFRDSEAELVVTPGAWVDQVKEAAGGRAVDQDALGDGEGWDRPPLRSTTTAMLQYTSGSTGTPKGVILTHGNLLANMAMAKRGFSFEEGLGVVAWVPLFHDLGLSLALAAPYNRGTATILAPEAFLRRPARWLEAISRYGATLSGAPNFAFDLCALRVTPEEQRGLD